MIDKNIIEKLYLLYSERVYRTSYYLVRDSRIAEDIVHDTFVKAALTLNSVRDFNKIESWLCRIAANETYTLLRKMKKVDVSAVARVITERLEDNPEASYLVRETSEEVQNALNQLNPHDSLMVTLHYYEDVQLKEIAYIMNVPLGTVKSRLYRIRRKLLNLLRENGGTTHGKPFRQMYP
ncbi:MAG: RNA polymerase sigma factor [Clostridiales bacterium]|jgi:RNA polymerase sigma-70 factor (ECF subfamily)|nr:RNA polymerase sigma factor [Clostridiales bacterium]